VIQDVPGMEGSSLTIINNIVDYNLTNNPPLSSYYDKATDQDSAGDSNKYTRIYSYDALNRRWALYDSRNTESVDDFTELVKGKGYWGKIYLGAESTSAGLVLGSSSISSDEYLTAGITEGWNLLSFDNQNAIIRKSSTGLIVELKATRTDDGIKIWDYSANHFVTALVDGTSLETATESCLSINEAIKEAKLTGTMPKTFDLKAFVIDATHIVLISTKRFMIDELSADSIGEVTTLTGANPYTVNPADMLNTDDTVTMSDLDYGDVTKAALSKYNEYALIVEPLVGTTASTAATLAPNTAKIHIQNAASDATIASPVSLNDGDDDSAGAVTTQVAADFTGTLGGGNGVFKSVAIDTDYNAGVVDKILIASNKPFYVRDYTFSRVFKFTDQDGDNNITLIGLPSGDASVTLVDGTDDNASTAADTLDAAIGDVKVEDDGSGNIIFISSAENSNEFQVTEATAKDYLEDASTTSNLDKGAIKGVYSLDSFATRNLNNSVKYTIPAADIPDSDDDNITVQLKNIYGNIHTASKAHTSAVANPTAAVWAAELQRVLEDEMSAAQLVGDVSCIDSNGDVNVTIVSTDIQDIAWTWVGGEPELAFGDSDVVKGTLVQTAPDLSADLKFNAVYTPNYVLSGPLYTIQKAGYRIEAMVTGTTDLSDGSINWESIDLTRKPSEWLDSQDYNLFSTDEESGYWVYLTPSAYSNSLTITNPIFRPQYTYHFNANGTTYNHLSGNIQLEINGIPDVDTRDSAVITVAAAGSIVELARSASSNVYSGKISSYELLDMSSGFDYDITANIADGLGYNLINTDTTLKIDYKKPLKPTIDLGDGTSLILSSESSDTAGFYIFKGQIPEKGALTSADFVDQLSLTEASAYPICQKMDKLTAWDSPAYNLNIIAVDGTGIFGGGNASDVETSIYVPMLKNSVKLIDVNNGESDSTELGTIYGSDCALTGAQTEDYGISLTSETDLQTVKVAYEPKNGADLSAPLTVFVNATAEDSSVLAKILYSDVYVGDVIYIELQGIVYSYELKAEDTEGVDADNPVDLSDPTKATKRVNQAL
jgi:hypothetical protein